jgi:hypothetical protein
MGAGCRKPASSHSGMFLTETAHQPKEIGPEGHTRELRIVRVERRRRHQDCIVLLPKTKGHLHAFGPAEQQPRLALVRRYPAVQRLGVCHGRPRPVGSGLDAKR